MRCRRRRFCAIAALLAQVAQIPFCDAPTFALPLPRRQQLAVAVGGCLTPLAARAETVKLQRVIAEGGLEDWQTADYQAMVDDEPRTQGYEAAIKKRLEGTEGKAVVLDIGTGSFALLAIMAAKAGAKKVYAIEKNVPAAKAALEEVKRQKLEDKIEVIEGDSMEVNLPEKVDLIVSELIGSIATQEGVEPIIKDATKRLLKADSIVAGKPGGVMIPARTQTRIAPVRWINHRVKTGASLRGVKSRGKAEPGTLRPLRLRGRNNGLIFLAEPQSLEDFDFLAPESTPSRVDRTVVFDISAKAANDAKDFSGFAMWTRLVIDDEHAVEVKGQKQTSHWAYVVALMADEPQPLPAPSSLTLTASIDYAARPVRYSLETEVPV